MVQQEKDVQIQHIKFLGSYERRNILTKSFYWLTTGFWTRHMTLLSCKYPSLHVLCWRLWVLGWPIIEAINQPVLFKRQDLGMTLGCKGIGRSSRKEHGYGNGNGERTYWIWQAPTNRRVYVFIAELKDDGTMQCPAQSYHYRAGDRRHLGLKHWIVAPGTSFLTSMTVV